MMTERNFRLIGLILNLFAVGICSTAFVLNVISGNIFLAVLMACIVPLNTYVAYLNFKRVIKSLGK
jgi:hypothetical protein